MRRRRLATAAAVLLLLPLALAAVGFVPWVRAQAHSRASRLGAVVSIRSVRPAWLGARLDDVAVAFPELPALSAHFDSVIVHADRSIHARSGTLSLRGPFEEVRSQLDAWRAAHGAPSGTSPAGDGSVVEVSEVAIDWADPFGPSTSLHLRGLSIPDLRHVSSLTLSHFDARSGGWGVVGRNLLVEFDAPPGHKLRLVRLEALEADVALDDHDPGTYAAGFAPSGSPAVPKPALQDPPGALRRLLALNSRLRALLPVLAQTVDPDATVEAGALELHLQRGSERLTLGPGPLSAAIRGERAVVSLSPGGTLGRSGVTFHLEAPLHDGDVRLDVEGGPIALSTLGVKEGDLGLTRLEKTSLEVHAHFLLNAPADVLQFDGTVRADNLTLEHPKLAEVPVEGLLVAAKGKGEVRTDGSRLDLSAFEVDVGLLQLTLSGWVTRGDDIALDVAFGIPMVGCQAFLDALPTALIPAVKGMAAAGTLSLTGRLRFDPRRPGDFLLDYQASNDCRVTSVPLNIDVARFRAPFRRKVYAPDGKLVEVETGPGTPGWTPLGAMSRYLEVAVMTTEDAHFRTHHGFDHEAIRNSVRENLLQRKFVRGASTISMQLAKNLYLDRRKTLSRKLQEIILTSYLEQALTKDQILELYLNVIEFGPMIYGAGPAAYHYFHAPASSLSLGQALYLSSILPNPSRQHFGADGRVTEGWMRYLQKLMKNAERRRWISPEELEEGLGEWVVFGSPAPERAGLRPASTGDDGPEPDDPAADDAVP
jgi:hypothetical protein